MRHVDRLFIWHFRYVMLTTVFQTFLSQYAMAAFPVSRAIFFFLFVLLFAFPSAYHVQFISPLQFCQVHLNSCTYQFNRAVEEYRHKHSSFQSTANRIEKLRMHC